MRQHIIISSNVHGIQASHSSAVAIVAAHDVAALGMRSWKPLCKCDVPVSRRRVVRPEVGRGPVVTPPMCGNTMTETKRTVASRYAASSANSAWPAMAFEPPAAAWARLVIHGAISI